MSPSAISKGQATIRVGGMKRLLSPVGYEKLIGSSCLPEL